MPHSSIPFTEPKTFEEAIEFAQTAPPLRRIKAMLDRTDLSADIKALLFDIAKFTVKAGDIVIAVGRRGLDIAMTLIQEFPHMVLGVVVALVLSTIIGAIPLLGLILSATLTKLLLLLGLTAGAIEDIRQNAMKSAMDQVAPQPLAAPCSGRPIIALSGR